MSNFKFNLLKSALYLCISIASFFIFQNNLLTSIPDQKPILFLSRQIPCCGSVYMQAANALPGVGGFSKFQVAAPGFLCILNPDHSIDTLINGSKPSALTLQLIDVSAPSLSWDATQIVFAGLKNGTYDLGNQNMTKQEHNAWRIYKINVDGSNLMQLSFDEAPLDLSQFSPLARNVLKGFDDTDPVWLPDGRICFSSTRYPDIGMYNVTRTSNLYVMNDDGSDLHRITSEKNGADRPVIDPVSGKIVFSRWWRNFYWPYDPMETEQHPVYTNGWLHKDGLTSNLDDVIDGQTYMFNNNSFFLTEINPDGSGLALFSSHYRELSSNSVYGGSFTSEGDFIGNWFPIEHVTESSGFGGIKKYFRGSKSKPKPLAGTTSYGNLDYYLKNPTSYGIFRGEYAAEPSVTNDGRILFSKTADPYQDYGIWIMNGDGSGQQLVFDHPGTTELHAQFIEARITPPVRVDKHNQKTSTLSPKGINELYQDGSFIFDCRNIFFNSPIDDGIIAAPAVGNLETVRFFANPLLGDQYGSLEMLNYPILYNEIQVDEFSRVLEKRAPANLPLFEQARSSVQSGYKIPRTGGGVMDGAAHVAGFNYGKPNQKVSCVGCHVGHSMIPVPEDPEKLFFTNVAPGARIKASSSMNPAGYVIDKKNYTATNHWFTPEGVDPKGQWLKLHWLVPVYAKKLVLHNIPDSNRASIKSCKILVYEDSSFQQKIKEFISSSSISPNGTEFIFDSITKMQALKIEFDEVTGGIYHWNAATIGEVELIASPVDPKRFKEICDCKGIAYGGHVIDSCHQCLLPEDPKFNDCLTKTQDQSPSNELTFYPNPVADILQIDMNSTEYKMSNISIYTLDAKKIQTDYSISNRSVTVNTSQLNSGIYILRLSSGSKYRIFRFVKL